MRLPRPSRGRPPKGVVLLALVSMGIVAAAAAPPSPSPEPGVAGWLLRMAERFEANPEWTEQRGTGWKPFNRLKWFHEQRMVDGRDPAPGARWEVREEKRRREGIRVLPYALSWFSLGPANLAGRMLALEFDPTNANVLYAGAASGGLWKSTDRGVTWQAMTDDLATLAVGGVAVLPANPNVVIIGTGEATLNIDRVGGVGILKSTDGGVTWNPTSLGYAVSQGHGFHFVEANPINGTLLAGATDGLWRSSDGGNTWTQVRNDGDYYDAAWKPGDANVCYTAKGSSHPGNKVKMSTDDGLTFANVGGATQPSSFSIGKTKIAMSAAAPSTIYAIYADNASGALLGVYRSTDGGANWTAGATTPNIPGQQGWYNLTLAADPNDATRVIAGGVSLYRSTDSGATFSQIGFSVHVDHHGIAYAPDDDNQLFVANDGGIWESTNDGGAWIDRNTGLVTYQFYDICVNNHGAVPDFLMGGTQDQGTDKWSGTTTWGEGLGGDGMVCNISPFNGTTVFAETQFGNHFKNTNAGVGGWQSIMNGITGQGAWVTPVDQDANMRKHLYTSTSDGIFRTTDSGNPWVNVAGHTATWISISSVDSSVVWTAGAGTWVTTDDGANWTQAAGFGVTVGSATKVLAHPIDASSAFVTFSGYNPGNAHVVLTTDLGASWQDVTGDLPSQPVNAIAVDPQNPGHWFIGTDVGVWVSVNGGVNWVPFDTGLPNAVVCDLEIQTATRKLFAGTHGRGAWEIDITSITSLEPEDEEETVVGLAPSPLNLMLDPPSPNPARDEVTLRFAARHEGPVVLEIYDIGGRLVTEVSRLPRGDGIIRWTTWYPEDVPSGVYFAVLRAGEDRKARKLVVAR